MRQSLYIVAGMVAILALVIAVIMIASGYPEGTTEVLKQPGSPGEPPKRAKLETEEPIGERGPDEAQEVGEDGDVLSGLLEQYGESAPFTATVRWHQAGKAWQSYGEEEGMRVRCLAMSWSMDETGHTTMRCEVASTGTVASYRNVHSWARQGGGGIPRLTAPELACLQRKARALPRSDRAPDLSSLVIVSFESGDEWLTRIYDRTKLPTEVRWLYEITGTYMESKPKRPQERAVLRGHTETVLSVSFSDDGKLLASASRDSSVRYWSVATGRQEKAIDLSVGIRKAAFSCGAQRLAAVHWSRKIRIWRPAAAGGPVVIDPNQLPMVRSVTHALAFSPDGKTLATESSGDIKFWDAATGELLATVEGGERLGGAVQFSHDGKTLAFGCYNGDVRLWDVEAASFSSRLKGHTTWIGSLAFSLDGNLLASTSAAGAKARLWDLAKAKERPWVRGDGNAVAVSPNGQLVATVRQRNLVILWNANTGDRLALYAGHSGEIEALAFSPDGKTLASAGQDKTVRLWDVSTISDGRRTEGPERPAEQEPAE